MIVLSLNSSSEDRRLAWDIDGYLGSLKRYATDFRCALELFDAASSKAHSLRKNTADPLFIRYNGWKFIAARDGAITAYNFRCGIENVTTALRKFPQLEVLTDKNVIKNFKRRFKATFPQDKLVRHGVGHAAEFAGTSELHAAKSINIGKAISSNSNPIYMSGMLVGREFTATVRQRVVSYTLDAASLSVLEQISSGLRVYLETSAVPLQSQ